MRLHQNRDIEFRFENRKGAHRSLRQLDALAVVTRLRRGEEICRQGHPAGHWHCVLQGAAERSVLKLDGRRQIVDLLLPGDFFAFAIGQEYDFTSCAVLEGTLIASYPRRQAEWLADSDPALAREIREAVFNSLARMQAQLLILGRVNAVAKVGSLLLDLEARLSRRGEPVVLPISRYDIADYLSLSVETVSRSLTDLKHRGAIVFSGTRRVRIVDRDALEDGDGEARMMRVRH
jgi:CRP/FNR family nitrogen fixation transcriptional regulator